MTHKKQSHDDLSLWQRVMASVSPLMGKRRSHPKSPSPVPMALPQRATEKTLTTYHKQPIAWSQLDGKLQRSAKNHVWRESQKLDLHGMTVAEAEVAVAQFVHHHFSQDHRWVMIITGRGTRGEGKLRQNIAHFLNQSCIQHQVLSFRAAEKKDGGDGAYYVRLRARLKNEAR